VHCLSPENIFPFEVSLNRSWSFVFRCIHGANSSITLDPKLPKSLYVRVLRKMLEEVETMRISLKPDMSDRLVVEAEGHFLSSLLAWGTTRSLKEHLKLFTYQTNFDNSHENEVRRTIESLRFRYEQSAVGYLDPSSSSGTIDHATGSDIHLVSASNSTDIDDSLYSVDDAFDMLAQRITIITFNASDDEKAMTMNLPTRSESNSRVVIDGMAKINMMKNAYDEALRCFLVLSAVHSIKSLEDIEQEALRMVNESRETVKTGGAYSFVLHLIEIHHLHQFLLETSFLPDGINCSPICTLIRLVGLELAGEFLMQNCTAPQQAVSKKSSAEERRGTLPFDLVADQLSGNQKLFHWYLHVLSTQRPELYVKFPTTANPPAVIATLHRKHLDLYIRYAGPNRDSTHVLENVEAYLVTERTTPLLSFLKVVLQLGTIGAIEAAKLLEIERRGGAGVSHTFALELAYILENYGNNTEADALLILELFLEGAQSLMLAVSFAQRTKSHSTKLWEKLIAHCLLKSSVEKTSDGSFSGMLFGSLLEAAALSGADLSHLVAQIPKGMQVEGLRPRLIAAVADYRLKVQLHSKSCDIAIDEKSALFIESTLRCRRGMRYENSTDMAGSVSYENNVRGSAAGPTDEGVLESPSILSTQLRPRSRLDRYSHSLQIPIR
jgi:vacuolar protein sorting-associated protein 41